MPTAKSRKSRNGKATGGIKGRTVKPPRVHIGAENRELIKDYLAHLQDTGLVTTEQNEDEETGGEGGGVSDEESEEEELEDIDCILHGGSFLTEETDMCSEDEDDENEDEEEEENPSAGKAMKQGEKRAEAPNFEAAACPPIEPHSPTALNLPPSGTVRVHICSMDNVKRVVPLVTNREQGVNGLLKLAKQKLALRWRPVVAYHLRSGVLVEDTMGLESGSEEAIYYSPPDTISYHQKPSHEPDLNPNLIPR